MSAFTQVELDDEHGTSLQVGYAHWEGDVHLYAWAEPTSEAATRTTAVRATHEAVRLLLSRLLLVLDIFLALTAVKRSNRRSGLLVLESVYKRTRPRLATGASTWGAAAAGESRGALQAEQL